MSNILLSMILILALPLPHFLSAWSGSRDCSMLNKDSTTELHPWSCLSFYCIYLSVCLSIVHKCVCFCVCLSELTHTTKGMGRSGDFRVSVLSYLVGTRDHSHHWTGQQVHFLTAPTHHPLTRILSVLASPFIWTLDTLRDILLAKNCSSEKKGIIWGNGQQFLISMSRLQNRILIQK